ncbi:MAG: LysR family transcriptional regulator [Anaerolineales bacterium]|nr:LysR family transcriptional regulator [Anaerolineales bacterium]
MDIRKIEIFLSAAETSSLSEAAKQLHLSQPALSHQIKLLEEELEVKLFTRSSTGLKLTDAGQLLMPWARRIIHDTNDMKNMMSSLQNILVGDLRIACSSSSGKYILPVILARFCKRSPSIQAHILACRPRSAITWLLDGEAHLGIVSSEVSDDSLESQEFFRDSISLIVPARHPWATRYSIEAAEILQEPLIMREDTSGTRKVMLEELAKFDIGLEDLKIFLEVGNAEAVVEIVAGGFGVSFVSDLASKYLRELGRVVKVKVDGVDMRRINYMVRKREAAPHRPSDVFWGFIHAIENTDLLHTHQA